MVYLAYKLLQPERSKILGMAGVLDTARFKFFIAEEMKISVKNVSAFVLGGHGDSMVPLARLGSAAGAPLEQSLSPEALKRIVQRTQNGGGEIVRLLQTGSAFFAPALSAALMVEAILKDKKEVLPCGAYLDGEYGERDVFAGAPCLLGAQGIEKIVELPLNEEEKKTISKIRGPCPRNHFPTENRRRRGLDPSLKNLVDLKAVFLGGTIKR